MLMKIFRPEWDEATRKNRRPDNEELYGLHASPNTIQAIKSEKKIIWAGHVARIGENRGGI